MIKDINECEGNHSCNHICVNKNGYYKCLCDAGYILQSDKRTCKGFCYNV